MLMFGDNCATKSATGIWLGLRKSTAQGGVPYLWHLSKNRYMQRASHSDDRRYSRFPFSQAQGASRRARTVRPRIDPFGRTGHTHRGQASFPLIASDGPKVHLSNEQIYEHIEFP